MAIRSKLKVINKAYYRRIEFGGQTEGGLEQAQKIKANLSKYKVPAKILPTGNKRYEVWRQD